MEKAVLFLIFNRPDTTAEVFERIRAARPSRLYVAGDGARPDREGEIERVAKARAIATDIDWPCEVKTLFRDENLGCKHAVSGALDWFFEQEEEGIILEDDCVPDPSFFRFCEEMLERYRGEERVATISGNNFVSRGPKDANRYYFSKYFHCWGWATWRRGWQLYRGNLQGWPEWNGSRKFQKWLPGREEQVYWSRIFDRVYAGEIDTWDYPFLGSLWMAGKVSIQPGVNLVENIGFGEDATHTRGNSNCPSAVRMEFPIRPRVVVRRRKSLDRKIFGGHFQPRKRRRKEKGFKPLLRALVMRMPKWVGKSLYVIGSPSYRRESNEARLYESLLSVPRFLPGKIHLEGRKWVYADARSFYYAYEAIYQRECFAVRMEKERPRILDGGAHVGMASRYWKERMPGAEISAIEADGDLVALLRENIEGLGEPPVEVIHGALWKNSKGVEFAVQGADAGFVVQGDEPPQVKKVKVPSVTLEDWVGERPVDLLKMNIEGAETEVLRAGRAALSWVDRIFVEYHSCVGEPQELADLLGWLREAGFRVWIESEYHPRQPFVRRHSSHGMDLQLNISGMKEALL